MKLVLSILGAAICASGEVQNDAVDAGYRGGLDIKQLMMMGGFGGSTFDKVGHGGSMDFMTCFLLLDDPMACMTIGGGTTGETSSTPRLTSGSTTTPRRQPAAYDMGGAMFGDIHSSPTTIRQPAMQGYPGVAAPPASLTTHSTPLHTPRAVPQHLQQAQYQYPQEAHGVGYYDYGDYSSSTINASPGRSAPPPHSAVSKPYPHTDQMLSTTMSVGPFSTAGTFQSSLGSSTLSSSYPSTHQGNVGLPHQGNVGLPHQGNSYPSMQYYQQDTNNLYNNPQQRTYYPSASGQHSYQAQPCNHLSTSPCNSGVASLPDYTYQANTFSDHVGYNSGYATQPLMQQSMMQPLMQQTYTGQPLPVNRGTHSGIGGYATQAPMTINHAGYDRNSLLMQQSHGQPLYRTADAEVENDDWTAFFDEYVGGQNEEEDSAQHVSDVWSRGV